MNTFIPSKKILLAKILSQIALGKYGTLWYFLILRIKKNLAQRLAFGAPRSNEKKYIFLGIQYPLIQKTSVLPIHIFTLRQSTYMNLQSICPIKCRYLIKLRTPGAHDLRAKRKCWRENAGRGRKVYKKETGKNLV